MSGLLICLWFILPLASANWNHKCRLTLIQVRFGGLSMLERIRPIREKGIEILLVDASNCQPREVEAIARTVPSYVTTRPRGSVLLLVDFSGASIDSEA